MSFRGQGGRGRGRSSRGESRGGFRGSGRGRGRGTRGTRGGERGRGRGTRGTRGGERGRGGFRGRGEQERGTQRVEFHDKASLDLMREIDALNKDVPGTHLVKYLIFDDTPWTKIESLSSGNWYFLNRENDTRSEKEPPEISGKQGHICYEEQGIKFANRPTQLRDIKLKPISNIITNAYIVTGELLNIPISHYLVEFDPPIPPEELALRQRAVLGTDRKSNLKNEMLLRKTFDQYVFDNHALYAFGKKSYPHKVELELSETNKVTFLWFDDLYLSSPNITTDQQQSLLNISNRRIMQEASFTRIVKGWFFGRKTAQVSEMKSIDIGDCRVLQGYECSIQVLTSSKSAPRNAVFKADMISKLVSRSTIHDMRPNGSSVKDLLNRYFCVTYSSQTQRISDLDFNQNENSTFRLKTGEKISYAEYLKSTYAISSPLKEWFVIKDRNDRCFLPQHVRLTLRPEEVSNYTEVLQHTTAPIDDRLARIDGLIEILKKTGEKLSVKKKEKSSETRSTEEEEKKKDDSKVPTFAFEIDKNPLIVKGYELRYPNISYKTREEGKVVTTSIQNIKWGESGGGYIGKIVALKKWAIIADLKNWYAEEQIQNIYQGFEKFVGARGLPEEAFADPDVLRVDFKNIEADPTLLKKPYQLVLLLLPEGERGSEYKCKFTRFLQSETASNKACLIQCIIGKNARNPNVTKGSFDAVMAKIGNVLFKIDPKLPNGNSVINMEKTWCVGMELSHRAEKPSAVILALSTAPLEGSLRSWHFTTHLNPSRRDVVTLEGACSLMFDALEMALQNVGSENFPENLIILRGGMPDNRLSEVYSKEVSGLMRGLAMFKEQYGKTDDNIKKWKCYTTYIVRCKHVLDRFGKIDANGRVTGINAPAVIFEGVTSERFWDFYLFPYHPKKDEAKTRPSRYVVLKDEMHLEKRGGVFDLYQLLYALTYTFVFSVPFPLGPTGAPGPLQYAKHYAHRFSQMIFKSDSSIEMLKRSTKLINQPQVSIPMQEHENITKE